MRRRNKGGSSVQIRQPLCWLKGCWRQATADDGLCNCCCAILAAQQ